MPTKEKSLRKTKAKARIHSSFGTARTAKYGLTYAQLELIFNEATLMQMNKWMDGQTQCEIDGKCITYYTDVYRFLRDHGKVNDKPCPSDWD
jgi:hypothetical protein